MSDAHVRPPRQPLATPAGAELHLRDMTATFAAELTLREVQARLAEHGQWLPVDGDPDAPLSALVETNSTGPLRLGYGAWRDLLLGVQFTNGRGELITAGGRTVKNVAGYDLTKFMVGQRGMFGKFVTVTTRTYRRPAGAALARFPADVQILNALLTTPLRPQWALLSGDALLLGYLGDEQTLAYYDSAVRQPPHGQHLINLARHSLDEDIRIRGLAWSLGSGPGYDGPGFRASVPPARLGELVPHLQGALWTADPAFGIVIGFLNGGSGGAPALCEAVAAVGGTVTFHTFHYPSGAPLLEVSTTSAERRIIERLKDAFDPDGTLTPLPWREPRDRVSR